MSDIIEETRQWIIEALPAYTTGDAIYNVVCKRFEKLITKVEQLRSEKIDSFVNHNNVETFQRAEYDIKIESLQYQLTNRADKIEQLRKKLREYESGCPNVVRVLEDQLATVEKERDTWKEAHSKLKGMYSEEFKQKEKLEAENAEQNKKIIQLRALTSSDEDIITKLNKQVEELKVAFYTLGEGMGQIIVKLEAENNELKKLIPEWSCDGCNKTFPGPTTLNLMCPENCGGTLITEELRLIKENAKLKERVEESEAENKKVDDECSHLYNDLSTLKEHFESPERYPQEIRRILEE